MKTQSYSENQSPLPRKMTLLAAALVFGAMGCALKSQTDTSTSTGADEAFSPAVALRAAVRVVAYRGDRPKKLSDILIEPADSALAETNPIPFLSVFGTVLNTKGHSVLVPARFANRVRAENASGLCLVVGPWLEPAVPAVGSRSANLDLPPVDPKADLAEQKGVFFVCESLAENNIPIEILDTSTNPGPEKNLAMLRWPQRLNFPGIYKMRLADLACLGTENYSSGDDVTGEGAYRLRIVSNLVGRRMPPLTVAAQPSTVLGNDPDAKALAPAYLGELVARALKENTIITRPPPQKGADGKEQPAEPHVAWGDEFSFSYIRNASNLDDATRSQIAHDITHSVNETINSTTDHLITLLRPGDEGAPVYASPDNLEVRVTGAYRVMLFGIASHQQVYNFDDYPLNLDAPGYQKLIDRGDLLNMSVHCGNESTFKYGYQAFSPEVDSFCAIADSAYNDYVKQVYKEPIPLTQAGREERRHGLRDMIVGRTVFTRVDNEPVGTFSNNMKWVCSTVRKFEAKAECLRERYGNVDANGDPITQVDSCYKYEDVDLYPCFVNEPGWNALNQNLPVWGQSTKNEWTSCGKDYMTEDFDASLLPESSTAKP